MKKYLKPCKKKTLFAGQIKRAMDRNDCNNMA